MHQIIPNRSVLGKEMPQNTYKSCCLSPFLLSISLLNYSQALMQIASTSSLQIQLCQCSSAPDIKGARLLWQGGRASQCQQHRQQDEAVRSSQQDQRHVDAEVVHLKNLGLGKRQHHYTCTARTSDLERPSHGPVFCPDTSQAP